jgi:uncharacterized membrane protein
VTINGIPVHPLVVHAAVVLVPLAALFAGAYAVLPRRRWQTRTPAAVLAVVAAGAVQLAAMTGDLLKETLHEDTSLIQAHEHWAGLLQAAAWVLAGLKVIAWWALPHENPLPDKDHRDGVTVLAKPLVVLLPVTAVSVLVLVVLTGDAGARAVWGNGGRDNTSAHGLTDGGEPRCACAASTRRCTYGDHHPAYRCWSCVMRQSPPSTICRQR